jgi:hypothetical protein
VQADRVADVEAAHVLADFRDLAGDFVSECERERFDPRTSGAIVHIGVADAGGADTHEDITGTARWHRDVGIFDGVP